jgi:hypothetical protein
MENDHIIEYGPILSAPPPRRGSVARRVALVAGALCGICILAADFFGHSATSTCLIGSSMFCDVTGHYVPSAQGPNVIWYFLAFWPGSVAVLTGAAKYLATGRL